jgi:WD40 repeat protein
MKKIFLFVVSLVFFQIVTHMQAATLFVPKSELSQAPSSEDLKKLSEKSKVFGNEEPGLKRTGSQIIGELASSGSQIIKILASSGSKIFSTTKTKQHSASMGDFCTRVLEGHKGPVTSVDISSDGLKIVTASSDGTACVWDAQTGKQVILEGHSGAVLTVAFSPDCQLVVTGSTDNTVRIWDVVTGECLWSLIKHTSAVLSVKFSPSHFFRLVTTSSDETVCVWDFDREEKSWNCICAARLHVLRVNSVDFNPDGSLLATTSDDASTHVWDLSSGESIRSFVAGNYHSHAVAFSPCGLFVATASENHIAALWNITTRDVFAFIGHRGSVNSVAFNADGSRLITASNDKTVRIWDVKSQRCLYVFRGHIKRVTSAKFSPDGKFVASASADGTARIWEVPQDFTIFSHVDDDGYLLKQFKNLGLSQ